MSKLQLRKHLRTMTADDLAALVLEVYDARKEAKEYLEYYLNPDINAKYAAAMETVVKELSRVVRRKYAPRMSKIKGAVKLFRTYGPDEEMMCRMLTEIFELMCAAVRTHFISVAFVTGCATHLRDTVREIDRSALTGIYFPRLTAAVDSVQGDYYDSRQFRESMREAIETTAGQCGI